MSRSSKRKFTRIFQTGGGGRGWDFHYVQTGLNFLNNRIYPVSNLKSRQSPSCYHHYLFELAYVLFSSPHEHTQATIPPYFSCKA